ncbi:MAG: DNA-3-methyladenine glycosylase [Deltaproteobacteria bacterium]
MRLGRDFFTQPARDVARQLIGSHLVCPRANGRTVTGRVVEVEAYIGPEDLACHASRGRTRRTEVMFGPPGHAYVFLVYGIHHCLNVVTDPVGHPAAVLLRALEPLKGVSLKMTGPGCLSKALGIGLELNGDDVCGDRLHFLEGEPRGPVDATPRIGVDYAGRWARRRLRFSERGNPFVSGPRRELRKRLSASGSPPTVARR